MIAINREMHRRKWKPFSLRMPASCRWKACGGRLCHEGCDRILDHGVVCGLGIVARRKALGAEWRFNRWNRTEHNCKPVGQGRAMYHLVIATSVGTFHSWNEAGEQLLGIMAEKLMSLTQGFCIPDEILEHVVSSRWRLIVADTANCGGLLNRQLI